MQYKKLENWDIKKKIALIVVLLVSWCLIGYMLLVVAYAIPTKYMQENMTESVSKFGGSAYPSLMGGKDSQLDNFTDALMLLTASHIEENEPLYEQAINVTRSYVDNMNPYQTLEIIYGEGATEYTEISYARYWHGYLIFLKPLLAIFDYGTIRYILMFLQIAFFTLLVAKLTEINKKLVIPTFLMWLFLNPDTTMLSLQYSTVTIITFAAMIGVVFGDKYWKKCNFIWSTFFLMVGALTSYFDLLTYPIVSLGGPLILWLFLNQGENLREDIKQTIVKTGFWGIGYLGMWTSKWVLGSIITRNNIIENALEQVQIRTSTAVDENSFSVIETILKNFESSKFLLVGIIILEIIYLLIMCVRFKKTNWRPIYFIIFFYPFLWYLITTNHSYIHSWFTYREMAISVYAFGVWIVAAFREPRKVKNRK